jgi:hypothetical protein
MRSGFVKGALLATFLFAGTHGVAAAELPACDLDYPGVVHIGGEEEKRVSAFHGAIFAATTRSAAPVPAELPPMRGTLCATFLDRLLFEWRVAPGVRPKRLLECDQARLQ